MLKCTYQFTPLDQLADLESVAILKAVTKAHIPLAVLQGLVTSLPNPNLLIATLALQEAKDSSAIENIITTHDDLYRSNYKTQQFTSAGAKEVHSYAEALLSGLKIVTRTDLLTNSTIITIQKAIEHNDAGFRKQGGTELKNAQTGEVVYTPPQLASEILELMSELEAFVNNNDLSDYDELIKMALIHHQFESIHPFYDGNGRTGRILNILYLNKQGLLDIPVLYLSKFLNKNKAEYYKLLQQVRDTGSWEPWVLFILKAVQVTSEDTLQTIRALLVLMERQSVHIKEKLPKIYSYELITNLFEHPYTKVDFLSAATGVHNNTARNHLKLLADIGVVNKLVIGKEHYYVNTELFELLQE
ncbi:MAG: Fic family protein [Paraglaciecola sp.]|jgi:Fic family protein